MKRIIALAAIVILFSVGNAKSQDTLVSAFFGLDNALPGMLCNQPGNLLDGMPVNFQFPLDASSLSETDFEVLDNLGNVHAPICALLARPMKMERIELCFCWVNLAQLFQIPLSK